MAKKKPTAMIVWGGWQGHDPDLCASMYRTWLNAAGYDVRVETQTSVFADPAIHELSLIVPIFTMSKIERAEAINLCAAVQNGVGVAGHLRMFGDELLLRYRHKARYRR